MAFVLTDFEPRLRDLQPDWTALSVESTARPISSNYGKAIAGPEFESAEWLASVLVWETGEFDLDAGWKADGRLVAKHYDLDSSAQLGQVFSELIALLRDGTLPIAAVTSWLDWR